MNIRRARSAAFLVLLALALASLARSWPASARQAQSQARAANGAEATLDTIRSYRSWAKMNRELILFAVDLEAVSISL